MTRSLYNFFRPIDRLMVEEHGATTTEYAVILGLILVAVIAGAALFGTHFTGSTSAISSGLSQTADPLGGSFGANNFRPQSAVYHR